MQILVTLIIHDDKTCFLSKMVGWNEFVSKIDLVENYETTANKFHIEMYCSEDYELTTLTGIQKINLSNILVN